MNNKVFILSYKKSNKFTEVSEVSKKRFQEMKYKPVIIEGYNLSENPEIKPNEVCYRNIQDFILDKLKTTKHKGILVAEDDAYISEILTPSFLFKRLKTHDYLNNIVRIGYQKVLKFKKGKAYPRGFYCVGTQLIWFPKSKYEKIKRVFDENRPQHLDGFLSKNMDLKIKLLDREEQKKEKYVEEIEHFSTTIGRTRKGIKINNIKKKSRKRKTNKN